MLENDDMDWELWEPIRLFEEKLNLPKYAQIREADKFQRNGYATRAQPLYAQECRRCDKTILEACAAAHEAESHRAEGEWEQAIRDYQRAFECFHSNDQPHNIAVTHLMLGLCYQATGDCREAIEHFTQAHTQFNSLLEKHRGQGNRRHVGKYAALSAQALLLQRQSQALAKAAATTRVWINDALYHSEDLDGRDNYLQFHPDSAYRVYSVASVGFKSVNLREGDSVVVEQFINGQADAEDNDVVATIVEGQPGVGVTIRKLFRRDTATVGKVVSILKRVA